MAKSPKGKKGKKQTTKDESPLAEDKSNKGKVPLDGKSPKGKFEKKGGKPIEDEKIDKEKSLSTNDENNTNNDKNENVPEKEVEDEPTDDKKTPNKKSPKKKSPTKKSLAAKSVEHPRKRLEMGNASKSNENKDETTEEESTSPTNEVFKEKSPPTEGESETGSTEQQMESSDTPDVPVDTTDRSLTEKTVEMNTEEKVTSVESSNIESETPMDTSTSTSEETPSEGTPSGTDYSNKDTDTKSAETIDTPMEISETPINEPKTIPDEDSLPNKEPSEKNESDISELTTTGVNDSIIICESESDNIVRIPQQQVSKVVDITDDDNSFEEGDISTDNISGHNLSNDDEERTVEEGETWTTESRLESFLRWSRSHGIWMSPKVKATHMGTVHRYGMLATEDIKRGDTLFVVPRALTLHPDNSRIVAEIVDYEDWLDSIGQSLDDSSGWATLLIALMLEFNDKDSYWAPYLRLVPSPEEFGHPLFWTPEEHKEELKGTTLLFDIQRDVYNIESEYKQFILPFIYRYKDICGRTERYNLSLYKRLVAFVMAYSFTEDFDTQPGMIPMADLLNHSIHNNAHLVYGEDDLKMVALKNIKKGDEIFNTFGKLGNAELLQMYGYAEKDPNIFDSLPVLVNTFLNTMEQQDDKVSDSFFQAKVSLLNKTEIAPADDFFLFDRNGMRKGPDLLQMLKILFMPEDEFEELLKSRAGNRPDSFYQKLLRKLKLARKTDTSSGVAIIDITDEEPELEPPPKRKIVDLQDCEEIEDNEPPNKFPRGCGGNEMHMVYIQGRPEQYPINTFQQPNTSWNGNSKTNAIVIDDSDEESDAGEEGEKKEEGEKMEEGSKKEEGEKEKEKSTDTTFKDGDEKMEEGEKELNVKEKEKEEESSNETKTKDVGADGGGEEGEVKDKEESADSAKDLIEEKDETKDDTSSEETQKDSSEKSSDKDTTKDSDKDTEETKSESLTEEKNKDETKENVNESTEESPKEKSEEPTTDNPPVQEGGKVNGDVTDVVSIEDTVGERETRDSDVDDIEIVSEEIRCKMTYANLNKELKPEWREFIKKVLQAVLVGIKEDADMSTSDARQKMSDREFFSYQVRQGQRSIVKTFIASLVT